MSESPQLLDNPWALVSTGLCQSGAPQGCHLVPGADVLSLLGLLSAQWSHPSERVTIALLLHLIPPCFSINLPSFSILISPASPSQPLILCLSTPSFSISERVLSSWVSFQPDLALIDPIVSRF